MDRENWNEMLTRMRMRQRQLVFDDVKQTSPSWVSERLVSPVCSPVHSLCGTPSFSLSVRGSSHRSPLSTICSFLHQFRSSRLRQSFQSGTPVYVCVLVRPSLALVHSLPLSATFRLLVEEKMDRTRIAPARTGRTQTGSGGPSKRPAFAWTGELSPHCRQTLMESMRENEETNEDTSVWSREASELPIGPLKRPAIVCASKVSTWWLSSKSLKKHAGFDVEWMRGLQ